MREKDIIIKTADGDLDTFICHPEEDGPHPAVVIYMDAPAIREELRDMARRIATVGYYVALPNLYYRDGTEKTYGFDAVAMFEGAGDEHRKRMFELMGTLTNAKVVSDTGPLIEAVRADKEAEAGPMGCVGYCMSGQFIVAVAAAYPDDYAAAASYYGVSIITEEDDSPHLAADKIKAELYMAFAETDHYVPQETVDKIPAVFDAAGTNYRVEIYPGTDHGFAFPGRPAHNKAAGERHWERMFALFDRNLRG